MDVGNHVARTARELGRQLGEHAVERGRQIGRCEVQQVARRNRAFVTGCRMRLGSLSDERKRLIGALASAGTDRSKARRIYYLVAAGFVLASSIALAQLVFEPFGLGWGTYLLALAAAFMGGFWTDEALRSFANSLLLKAVSVVGFAAAVAALLLMANLRGDIFGMELNSMLASAESGSQAPEAGVAFYQIATGKLAIVFELLALAMEFAAGWALHHANRLAAARPPIDRERTLRRVSEIELGMAALTAQMVAAEEEPGTVADEFEKEFHLGLSEGLRSASAKGLIRLSVILLAFVLPAALAAQPRVVVGLDLTASMSATRYSGKSASEGTVEVLSQLIRDLPPGTELTVLAISDQSFSLPYTLLETTLPKDKGKLRFLDQIALARNRIRQKIEALKTSAPPQFPETDLLGFLVFAGDLLHQGGSREKALVLLSDMRHNSAGFHALLSDPVDAATAVSEAEQRQLMADLSGVKVYAVGVDGAGVTVSYWRTLRKFWLEYFRRTGAQVLTYSMTYVAPAIGR